MSDFLHPTDPLPERWTALTEEQREHRLELARAVWVTTEQSKTRPWEDMPMKQRVFAALMLPLVERTEANFDPQRDTFQCATCEDTGYIHREAHEGAYAKPCFCHRGDVLEAARWFERAYPMRDGKRHADNKELAVLDDVVRRHGVPAARVRDLVRDLLHQYNQRMKRTVQE